MSATLTAPTAVQDTFVIERRYPHAPEKVFAAFSDPRKKRRWFADAHGHDLVSYEMDFRAGGEEHLVWKLSEKSPFPGLPLDTRATFADIDPGRRIVFTQVMTMHGKPFSVVLATIEFLKDGAGTRLHITHHATFLENSDGPKMRRDGWESLLDNLKTELGA